MVEILTDSTFYLKANQSLLWQLKEQLTLLRESPDPIYRKTTPNIEGASIGAHLRHILDFYQAFCEGLESGKVNYDHRDRNPETEQLLSKGLFEIERIIEALNFVARFQSQPLLVKNSVSIDGPEPYLRSNLTRELQMLHSHTTHHMAIIGINFQLNQVFIQPSFGKAPSTIRFENQSQIRLSPRNKIPVSLVQSNQKTSQFNPEFV